MAVDRDILRRVAVVNVGLAMFGEAVRAQDAPAIDVDWRPPAGGDPEAVAAVTRLWGRHGPAVDRANAAALARMEATAPRAVTVRPAAEVLPVLAGERTLLHSGPPIEPDRLADPQRRALVAACVFEGWAPPRRAPATPC